MTSFIDEFEECDPNSTANIYMERLKRFEMQVSFKSFLAGFVAGCLLIWTLEILK